MSSWSKRRKEKRQDRRAAVASAVQSWQEGRTARTEARQEGRSARAEARAEARGKGGASDVLEHLIESAFEEGPETFLEGGGLAGVMGGGLLSPGGIEVSEGDDAPDLAGAAEAPSSAPSSSSSAGGMLANLSDQEKLLGGGLLLALLFALFGGRRRK